MPEDLVPRPSVAPTPPEVLEPMVASWLLSFGSPHTRTAYRGDLADWLEFCRAADLEPLAARRGHVDAYARLLEGSGRAPATVARRLAAVSSFYDYLLDDGIVPANPAARVRRPKVSAESATLGPTLAEARALLTAADADGPKAMALISLLLLNGLRVSEALGADVEDVNVEQGHRVLRVTRKGGRVALVPLAPRTWSALKAVCAGRSSGPIFLGEHYGRGVHGRLTPSGATHIVSRVAKTANIEKHLSPHALRHGFVTLSLEAGAALVDVQDAAGHSDPRITQRYNRARNRLENAPTYTLASHIAA